jgi:predicted Zn-dependent protease
MPVFFERLQQSSRYYGQGIPEFLRTHPVSASRISDTRGRSNKYPYKQYPDSQGYLLSRAKLRVMTSSDKKKPLNYFKTREHQGTVEQQAIARYGIGLVYMETQKSSEAEKIFQQLTRQYPNQPQYAYAVAKTALESQLYDKALGLFEKAVGRFPTNNAIKIEYISTLLKAKKPRKAKIILQSLNGQMKKLPLYFELLAQAYANLKLPAESHRYLAEYYYASGQTKAAILQINLAKKADGINFYLQAILDDRLRFFHYEEKQRKKNQ